MSTLRLHEALTHANVQAFLRVIREGESSQDEDAYRRRYHPTQRVLVDSLIGGHPRIFEPLQDGSGRKSSAFGAYQFTATTWDEIDSAYGLPDDISPPSQDLHAVALLDQIGALDSVLGGRFRDAVTRAGRRWSSLPEASLQDGGSKQSWDRAEAVYARYGGTQSPEQPAEAPEVQPPEPDPAPEADQSQAGATVAREAHATTQGNTTMMPTLIPALASAAADLLPEIGRILGDKSRGSAERNTDIAGKVLATIASATGASNEQAAIERMRADPAALEAARGAIRSQWYELIEAGSGGIAAARDYDAAAMRSGGPWWQIVRSPSFVIACLLLPLVYLIVLSLIGLIGGAEWSPDVRAALAGTIVGTIVGGLVGYYYGQMTSSNRTPAPGSSAPSSRR